MYVFLNSYSFEDPSPNCNNTEIKDTLSNIAITIKELNQIESDLVVVQNLPSMIIHGKELRNYIFELEDKEKKITLLKKFGDVTPYCSHAYDEYSEDENIILGNCKDENYTDILETFLACACYLTAPILTADKLCNREYFKKTPINIQCDENKSYELPNYFVSNYVQLLSDLTAQIQNNINDWDEYYQNLTNNFSYVEMTEDCFNNINRYAFMSDYGVTIRERIEKLNSFIEDNGGNPSNVAYSELGGHYNPETSNKQQKRKRQLSFKNMQGKRQVMSWHARIDVYRLYFYFDTEKIYFTAFVPKIPDP